MSVPLSATTRRRPTLAAVRDYGIVASFVLLFGVLSIASPVFLTQRNILNVLDESAQVGIMACGGTLVFIAGGFDLSIGAVFALAGIVAVDASLGGLPAPAALVVGVLVGLGVGTLNGVLTTVGRINAFIATIASEFVFRGVALVVTGGFLVTVVDPGFGVPGQGKLVGVDYQVLVWLVFAIACSLLLSRTVVGRYIYATGGNAEAARLSGVRVWLIRGTAFAISGIAAALAGVLNVSRVSSGESNAAVGIELTVIASIVLGGTSIYGGEGAIWRTVLGVLLLTMIGNGFNLLNVEPTYQQIFQGLIIVGAVAIDAWSRHASSA
jgi:ribose transport system permease protein